MDLAGWFSGHRAGECWELDRLLEEEPHAGRGARSRSNSSSSVEKKSSPSSWIASINGSEMHRLHRLRGLDVRDTLQRTRSMPLTVVASCSTATRAAAACVLWLEAFAWPPSASLVLGHFRNLLERGKSCQFLSLGWNRGLGELADSGTDLPAAPTATPSENWHGSQTSRRAETASPRRDLPLRTLHAGRGQESPLLDRLFPPFEPAAVA